MKMNKGEWSEPYCLLKVISEGQLKLCDSDLKDIGKRVRIVGGNISSNTSFKIEDGMVSFNDNGKLKQYPIATISPIAEKILSEIQKNQNRTFEINEAETFFEQFDNCKIKADNTKKADCNLTVFDENFHTELDFGFSIKSFLSQNPSLVNAGQATNFIFFSDVPNIKNYENLKTKSLVKQLDQDGYPINFLEMENHTYKYNLTLVDTQMPKIISELIKSYYSTSNRYIKDLVEIIKEKNPFNWPHLSLYEYKITDFLFYSATGMFPTKIWKGRQEADGGCIIVKEDGDVVTFYICQKDSLEYFRTYLYNNCYFDTPSTTRHKFGRLYKDNQDNLLKLNMQIRIS